MLTLLAIVGKDLRLLWRDRAGLLFLTLAPIMVITVAGFSLANLYGADPTGQTAYDFPFVDEDGSDLAGEIRRRLEADRAVRLHPVRDRAEAQRLVHDKQAGSALIVPQGAEATLHKGEPVSLVLYVDPVKYLERLNVEARLLALGEALATEQRAKIVAALDAESERTRADVAGLQSVVSAARTRLDATWTEAQHRREQALAESRIQLRRAQEQARQQIESQLTAASAQASADVAAQVAALEAAVQAYLDRLRGTRQAFESWFADLQRRAGSHAVDIPAPPAFPEIPESLRPLVEGRAPALHLAPPRLNLSALSVPALDVPPLPDPPSITLPEIALPNLPRPPGSLRLETLSLGGGSTTINTFDQNVPGFSVTFLLLGMLLGVSLGLLDERDWGTLDRQRAMPVPAAYILLGKLLSRFVVGLVQMSVLFAVGWAAFGISLGPQPWALLLPTIGIVFAGTAFGLIVAAIATSREAVLPVGSIVIVTMAAVGGCWWPIDLEPRWMRTVALAFPTTWAMDAYNDLMIRRRAVGAAFLPTAVMLLYGLLDLGAGVWLVRRRHQRR